MKKIEMVSIFNGWFNVSSCKSGEKSGQNWFLKNTGFESNLISCPKVPYHTLKIVEKWYCKY